ncbi:TPA: J domain-containing protein, partial [Candidatus Woesearchaeota archaeon]|nr:J domain-containing protein [Candidatus Woesearchaeota archaeon]
MQVVEALRILEVSENTPWSTIKTRYKVLARKYHPDFNPGDEEAEELFRQLCTAYELLNNAYQGKVSAQQDTSTDQRGSSVPANPAKAEGVMRNIVAAAAARVRKRNEERHEQYKAGKRGGRGRGDDFFDPFDTIFPGSARASS